jgi:hypothetical protein
MTFDERMSELDAHIAAIEAGSASVTDEQVLDLASRAICVFAEHGHSEVTEHESHDEE